MLNWQIPTDLVGMILKASDYLAFNHHTSFCTRISYNLRMYAHQRA
jgi:hypothetical protein